MELNLDEKLFEIIYPSSKPQINIEGEKISTRTVEG
jgi:hypothetical protein